MTDALNTTIIECGREQNESTLALGLDYGLNAKWNNQLKTAIFVNTGDKVSVASSSINAVGNDAGTIEMEGVPSHRDGASITDGQATMRMNEYKSADGTFYDFCPVKRTNQDRRIAPKIARHTGKKFTRCIFTNPPSLHSVGDVYDRIPVNSNLVSPNSNGHEAFHSFGEVNGEPVLNDLCDTFNLTEDFTIFERDITIDIPKGFFAPQQIANSITQQLQKVNNIDTIKMNVNNYLGEDNWIYRKVGSGQPCVSTIIESNCFKPRPACPLAPANAENQAFRGEDPTVSTKAKTVTDEWKIATDTMNAYMYGIGGEEDPPAPEQRGNRTTKRGGGFNNKDNPSIENSIPSFEATLKQVGGQSDQRNGYWEANNLLNATIRSGTEYNSIINRAGDFNQPIGTTLSPYKFGNDTFTGSRNVEYTAQGIPTTNNAEYTYMSDFYALNPELILEGKKVWNEVRTIPSTSVGGEYNWIMKAGFFEGGTDSASEDGNHNIEQNDINKNMFLQTNMKWTDLINSIEGGDDNIKNWLNTQLFSTLDQVATLSIGGYGKDGSKEFGFSELTEPTGNPNRKFIHVESVENGGISTAQGGDGNSQTFTESLLGTNNDREDITWTQNQSPIDFAFNDYDPVYRGTLAQSVLYIHSLRNNNSYNIKLTSRADEVVSSVASPTPQKAVFGCLFKTLDYQKTYDSPATYTADDFYVSFVVPQQENILGKGIINPNDTLFPSLDPTSNIPLENVAMIYKGNKIGYSPVWNALGNECMSLNNGYLNWTALSDTITSTGGDSVTTPQLKFGLVSGNIDRVMIGAVAPKVNYDEIAGKYFISDFHSANVIHQDFTAGDTLETSENVGQSATMPLISTFRSKNQYPSPYNIGFNNNINSDAGTPIYSFHKVNRSNNLGLNADFNPAISHETERGNLYDNMSGLFITDFNVGINKDFWAGTLWDKLGFTYDNTHLLEGGRNIRNINYYQTTGRTQNTSGKYGITTGAEVLGKSALQLATGRFNQPLFSLGLNRMTSNATYGFIPTGQYPETMNMGNPLIKATSTQFTAFNLPTKTENSFYTICSDIVQGNSTYTGGRGGGERLPVISIVQKYYSGTDFFYGTDSSMGFTATKPFILNNITVEIRKPNGQLATNLSGRSTVIFRIDRRTPQPLPMNISQGGGSGTVKPIKEKETPLQMIEKQIRELTGKTEEEGQVVGEDLKTIERLYQPFLTEEQREGTARTIPRVDGREGLGSVQQRLQLAKELKVRGFDLEEEPIGRQRELIKALNIEKASVEQGRPIPFNIALGQARGGGVETRGRPKGAEQSLIDLQKYIEGVGERVSYQAFGRGEEGRKQDTEFSTRGEEVPPLQESPFFKEEGATLRERRAIEQLTKDE